MTEIQTSPLDKGYRGFLSIGDLTQDQLGRLVQRSCELFSDQRAHDSPLREMIIGLLFTATSTRTRTAFTTGAIRLGATVIPYGSGELQRATGETLNDTARVLGGMLDILVIRDAVTIADLHEFSRFAGIPVINAMAREEHPTQGVNDLAIMSKHFGSLNGIHVLYVGEGNNTSSALALGLAKTPGTRLTLATPAGYKLDPLILERAQKLATLCGSFISETHEVNEVFGEVDVVYATQWCTTGTVKTDPMWRDAFSPFAVDQYMMERYPNAIFMHDLPAHRGEEVTAEVLDGPKSLVWDQARMKQASAMAILEWCLGS